MVRAVETFLIFLRLGLTSFGGPIAHLGYFRDEFVTRRQWFTDKAYADLVALCQLLPGPASSQVGFAIGLARGRFAGALAAFLGFTLPSALVMGGLAVGAVAWGEAVDPGLLKGLKVVAAAVVAVALWGMASSLAPDAPRASIAVVAAVLLLVFPVQWMQLAIIGAALPLGWALLKAEPAETEDGGLSVPVGRRTGLVCIFLFFVLLFGLPVLQAAATDPALALADAFYRSARSFSVVVMSCCRYCRPSSCPPAGSRKMPSSPATARRRRCPGRSSLSAAIWAWPPTAGAAG